jgi:hypothetical protein
MASKNSPNPKQVHRQPSAVCESCSGELVAVERVVIVGRDGGKRWQCKSGHVVPRERDIVRV